MVGLFYLCSFKVMHRDDYVLSSDKCGDLIKLCTGLCTGEVDILELCTGESELCTGVMHRLLITLQGDLRIMWGL